MSRDQPQDPGTDATVAAPGVQSPQLSGVTPTLTPEIPDRYHFAGGKEHAILGRGGIGAVFLAMDHHVGREVAIKELLGGVGGSLGATPAASEAGTVSAAAARFLREARITGQLQHPNIVPVHEIGQRADGTLYYTMKVVRGQTLRQALKGCDNLAARLKYLGHVEDICQAIAYAHHKGVIHRDIKPDNVMVGEFGETVVLDWGLAKTHGKQDPTARTASSTRQSGPARQRPGGGRGPTRCCTRPRHTSASPTDAPCGATPATSTTCASRRTAGGSCRRPGTPRRSSGTPGTAAWWRPWPLRLEAPTDSGRRPFRPVARPSPWAARARSCSCGT